MSLLKLISNIDSSTKTKMLGDLTTKLLRYTFANSHEESLPKRIMDSAVAISMGEKLVNNKSKRRILLKSLRVDQLGGSGYSNFTQAVEYYVKNKQAFISDFDIEEKFLSSAPIDERVEVEICVPQYGECNGVNAFLHDYQYRLKRRISSSLMHEFIPNLLVTMPTGAGKTVLGMEVIVDYFRVKEKSHESINICWIVDSKELCEQSLQSFQRLWKQKGDHPVAARRYFSKFNKLSQVSHSTITFASFDLMVSRLNSINVVNYLTQLDLLIIDEAHASNADTYQKVIASYEQNSAQPKILGLTATPYRSDDDILDNLKSLFKSFIKIIDENSNEIDSPIEYLKNGKYLSIVDFETLSHSERSRNFFKYYNSLHKSILRECEAIVSRKNNVIIFAESKSHAICLSIYLTENNVENGLIIGETSDALRKNYLSRFGDNEDTLNVLVNHQILSTGIDVPGMNAIMILGTIDSPSLALQILGRAMRGPKNGGNEENKVYLTKENQLKLRNYKILESTVIN